MRTDPVIYILEHHHELLYLWRELQIRNISVLHLDEHCDMHGLLVNRKSGLANTMSGLKRVDCGNFLSFAVIEGIVKEITWVHDRYGGRNNDTTYVKYATDFTALPHLIKNKLFSVAEYPVGFTEHLLENTNYFEIGENAHLDIDWDFFFLKNKPAEERKKSIDLFLDHEFKVLPHYTYVTYSADYVVPSRREFWEFILQLKRKFNAEIVKYSYPLPKKEEVSFPVRCWKELRCGLKQYFVFPLKRRLNNLGIY